MTDIVERLRQAFKENRYGESGEYVAAFDLLDAAADEIERLRAAISADREACAKIVEFGVEHDWPGVGTVKGFGSNPVVAAAIRARGQT